MVEDAQKPQQPQYGGAQVIPMQGGGGMMMQPGMMQKMGYGDEKRLGTEILGSIFRAGADMIISYHTRDVFKDEWF